MYGIRIEIEIDAEERESADDGCANRREMFADPTGESERVEAAEDGRERSDGFRNRGTERFDREARTRIVGAFEQAAQVVFAAGECVDAAASLEKLAKSGRALPSFLR